MKTNPILLALLLALSPIVHAVDTEKLPEYIRAHYTKYEYAIPARDGVTLFTAVYVPKDVTKKYAIMLSRTPYTVSPYGVDQYRTSLGPSEKFAREGFIFAYQDVRGRYLSGGEFVEMRPHIDKKRGPNDVDESTDCYDTIDWLVKNIPGNNGKVGMWGISYPGFYTAAGMIDAHPALVAASPQAPVSDLYMGDDSFHNGAFFLAANFGFMTYFVERKEIAPPKERIRFDYGTKDGYEFFLNMGPLSQSDELYFHEENPYWTSMLEHTTYDAFWKSRNILTHLNKVPPAVMTVGGWFDAEDLQGPLKMYRSVGERNPKTSNHLVMGPWVHGGWARGDGDELGDVRFHANTSEFYRDEIEFPFFDYYLRGNGDKPPANAWVFETGTNQWRSYANWPPKEAKAMTFYLAADGALSSTAPEAPGVDTYVSDPAKPVPFLNRIATGVPRDYMVADQRFAAKRPDVLVYATEPLEHDIVFAGPIEVTLHVATSGTDSDFVVKLIDVYPNEYPDNEPNVEDVRMGGYQQLVRGEPFRAKFRNSFESPEAMVPNQETAIEYAMPDVYHAFRRGHRIMLQIQSSWFPLVDRNPQSFVDIPYASPDDFQAATQQVFFGPGRLSGVEVPAFTR